MSSELEKIRQLASYGQHQYGLVSTPQARLVLSRTQLHRWAQRGRLSKVAPHVYALPGAVPSWRQRAMAACLAYGPPVALSGPAAARLWELDGIICRHMEVTVPHERSGRIDGITAFRRALPPTDLTTHFDVPVTTLARTLVDLASCTPLDALARAMDDALARRLYNVDDLAAEIFDRGRDGRSGIRHLRRLVQQRAAEPDAVDSVWEARVYRWLAEAGIPPPASQYQVVISGVPRILDFAYPAELVAVEFQDFRYHALHRRRFDADQSRLTDLALAGWLVVLVTSSSSAAETVDRVRAALNHVRPPTIAAGTAKAVS